MSAITIDQVHSEIEDICSRIRELQSRMDVLTAILDKMKSQEFIRINNITLADVETSIGSGKPWWSDCYQFGRWLKSSGCTKRFCEWNGRLLFTSDLMAGHLKHTPGRLDDVQ